MGKIISEEDQLKKEFFFRRERRTDDDRLHSPQNKLPKTIKKTLFQLLKTLIPYAHPIRHDPAKTPTWLKSSGELQEERHRWERRDKSETGKTRYRTYRPQEFQRPLHGFDQKTKKSATEMITGEGFSWEYDRKQRDDDGFLFQIWLFIKKKTLLSTRGCRKFMSWDWQEVGKAGRGEGRSPSTPFQV